MTDRLLIGDNNIYEIDLIFTIIVQVGELYSSHCAVRVRNTIILHQVLLLD